MRSSLRENIEALQQGEHILQTISDAAYCQPARLVFESTVGMHIRHNLDHYACFLKGIKNGCIDYAARQRDSRLEQDRSFAITEISRIRQCLQDMSETIVTTQLLVETDNGSGQVTSSIKRELAFLLSHTTHHYAIVAVICQLQGLSVAEDFGVAASTLQHRVEQLAKCAH